MSMVTAKCPNCEKNIQIPDDVEITYCAYCGSKIETKNVILSSTNIVLIELKKMRDKEINDFLNGPGFNMMYRGWGLPTKHDAQIEDMDPKDVVSKEMRICAETRNMLYEACGENGLFAPAGMRFLSNKIYVCHQYEPLVVQHIDKINRDAAALISISPSFTFESTKALFLDIAKLDRTPELYYLFSNGLMMAFLSLQYYFIPAARKALIPPLGDKLAESFSYLAEQISLRMEEKDLTYAHKAKVLDLDNLTLLK